MVQIIKELAITAGNFFAGYFPFEGENIGIVLLIIVSLFIGSTIVKYIPPMRDKTAPWLIISGILFYLGWYFN
jgi:hypothetical protein